MRKVKPKAKRGKKEDVVVKTESVEEVEPEDWIDGE